MKIENQSLKRSHKLDGIGVGRIGTFPFLLISFMTPSLMMQWKLGCRSRKQKRKNQPIARPGIEHFHWSILLLLLATPTMQFSLDRKRLRHEQNQCSALDSVGLIFTSSYRSTFLITTPTMTPSLVKTSLYQFDQSKISLIVVYQRNKRIWSKIVLFLWCTMIWVILD